MRQIGYTRISTVGQDAQLQLDALLAAALESGSCFGRPPMSLVLVVRTIKRAPPNP